MVIKTIINNLLFAFIMKSLIAQGAESKLFLEDNEVIKDRFSKKYRLREIDEKLRKSRTRREAKILGELKKISFPAPKLIFNNEKDTIKMEFIKGKLLKNVLEKKSYYELSEEIGKKVAILHNKGIIHGDLTTSNMFLGKEIYFIDFGLSFFSEKIEDKAVDLHLLKEALESKHYNIWENCFKAALKGYGKYAKDSGAIIKRLDAVESRGRYKGKK